MGIIFRISLIIIIALSSISCATAKRYTKDGIDYLEMKGPGKAKWPDNAEIETLKFPSLPIKYEP